MEPDLLCGTDSIFLYRGVEIWTMKLIYVSYLHHSILHIPHRIPGTYDERCAPLYLSYDWNSWGLLNLYSFPLFYSAQWSVYFSLTNRSQKTRSGLDYKKTVLIKDTDYITSGNSVIVDSDEYTAMIRNIGTIVTEIDEYISTYTKHINGTQRLHERAFARRYQFSTLPYFHEILGL